MEDNSQDIGSWFMGMRDLLNRMPLQTETVPAKSRIVESKLRALLRKAEDGMTTADLAKVTKLKPQDITARLRRLPDAYIDRWVAADGNGGRPAAVWCVVIPPPDCPPPDKGR